jgi:tRNA dimethylallyltransferase
MADAIDDELPRAVAIVGPTGSGKGALGRGVAQRLGLEVFVCDSVKVYRGLDIGSAKPTPAQRREVPHHLIDLADPDAAFSAGDYAAAAWPLRSRVRGLFVGGTGFYLRQLAWSASGMREGEHDTPADDPQRRAFDAQWHAAEQARAGATWDALAQIDPDTARAIHPANWVRVVRALWLCHRFGARVSAIRRAQPPRPRLALMLVVLDPPAEALALRLERRVDTMLERGWLAEVEKLAAAGYHAGHKAMQSLGYRQLLDVVEARSDLADARTAIVTATRQYARRQRTYFRHQFPGAHVIAIASADDAPLHAIAAHLGVNP